jgi:hypothetical protein
MVLQGGTQANINGQIFERHIITQLEDKGLTVIHSKEMDKIMRHNDWPSLINELYPGGVIVKGRNYYKSIYNNPRCFSEYRIFKDDLYFRLECKWQQGSGSVSEKIPYFYMNFIENNFPEPMCVFVHGGDAIIPAVTWLKEAWKNKLYVKDNFSKDLKILNLDQFMAWSNKEF